MYPWGLLLVCTFNKQVLYDVLLCVDISILVDDTVFFICNVISQTIHFPKAA